MSTRSLIEISLHGLDDETTPSVISLFNRWGRGGAVVEQGPGEDAGTTLKTYLLSEDETSLRQIEIGLEVLNQALGASTPGDSPTIYGLPKPCIRFLSETDWAEAWKANYDVLRVGRQLVIKPTWCAYAAQPDDLVIELDPGMAFGSGLHPTTRLCLEAMEGYLRRGTSVLDVGTGSGILAIAAARLGASHVLALDTDPLAIGVARDNVVLNQVDSIVHVEAGTLQISNGKGQMANAKDQIPNGKGQRSNTKWQRSNIKSANLQSFDFAQDGSPISNLQAPGWDMVVANILAETVVELMPALVSNLAAEGTLIASGIILDREEAVIASLYETALSLVERQEDGEWVALVAREATKDGGWMTKDEGRTTKN